MRTISMSHNLPILYRPNTISLFIEMKPTTVSIQTQTDENLTKKCSGKAVYEKIENSTRYSLIQMVRYYIEALPL